MADISKIRLGNQGGTYTEYDIKDAAARQAAAGLETGIIYDVSALHPTSGVSGGSTYASLAAALAVIPQAKRKGGMSVKFVQSSDNNYVQYRLKTNYFSIRPTDWEGDWSVSTGNILHNQSFGSNANVIVFSTTNVKVGDIIAYSIYNNTNMASVIVFYDAEDNVLAKIGKTISSPSSYYLYEGTYAIPIGFAYAKVLVGNGGTCVINYINVKRGNFALDRRIMLIENSWYKTTHAIKDVSFENTYDTPQGYLHLFDSTDESAETKIYYSVYHGASCFCYIQVLDADNSVLATYETTNTYGSAGTISGNFTLPINFSKVVLISNGGGVINYICSDEANMKLYERPLAINSDFTSEGDSLATIKNKPYGLYQPQYNYGTFNGTNNPAFVINKDVYIRVNGYRLDLGNINLPNNKYFYTEPVIYLESGVGTFTITMYDTTDSKTLKTETRNAVAGENIFNFVYKADSDLSTHNLRFRVQLTTSPATSNYFLKLSSRYYSFLNYNPLLFEEYTSNDIKESLSDIGREICCLLKDYVNETGGKTYRCPVGKGGKYYLTLKRTGSSARFMVYASNVPSSPGNVIFNFSADETFETEKTFTFELEKGKDWYLTFYNSNVPCVWNKLLVERCVPKSSLSQWAGKTLSIYGDSIAAITNYNNGNGPDGYITGNGYEYGQKIAHYFHLGHLYGRGIGSQKYKFEAHGGSLCWLDTSTGKCLGRLNAYSYDDYLNPETQATVVAAAIANGYDSETMTFCRGSLSSWDRITKMYPASIKDTIDAIVVMSVNDSYDDAENHTWLDYAWIEESEVDTEWAASTYYATYGGDYNTNVSLQGGIASTIMKLQAWMPQARIMLCVSGAGGRYNTVHPELAEQEYTKYDSIIKMHRLLGCPLIDIYGTAGINGLNCMNYLSDGIHPYTTLGGQAYAAAIIGAMKGVVLVKDMG